MMFGHDLMIEYHDIGVKLLQRPGDPLDLMGMAGQMNDVNPESVAKVH
jgi:hypothetical protein